MSLPSCGLTLLRGPRNAFDYRLSISSDEKHYVHIRCHRAVLISHSKRFDQLINAENYFELEIKVKPGYVGPMIELLQFMYLKDPALISSRDKVVELCGVCEMPLDHFFIRQHTDGTSPHRAVPLNIVADESASVTTEDWLHCLRFERARVVVPNTSEDSDKDRPPAPDPSTEESDEDRPLAPPPTFPRIRKGTKTVRRYLLRSRFGRL